MAITTAVYVDGYNLYYGRIRNTCFKWIDVVRLFEILLHDGPRFAPWPAMIWCRLSESNG